MCYKQKCEVVSLNLAHPVGHDVFGGHMAVKRTKERIEFTFHWPTLHDDCREYVRTCQSYKRAYVKF